MGKLAEHTGKTFILSAAAVADLEAMMDETSGYFGRMIKYLDELVKTGVQEGKFSRREAEEDLDLGLWYAYAYLNLDTYDGYFQALGHLKSCERNAAGSGVWYYRCATALMYCGRLKEALACAEKGTREEPDYPWIWLEAAKLRSHFGDREGALAAVKRGLELVPGDYEFTTLRGEIEAGASLEEMEYHWIDPDCDAELLAGRGEGGDAKQLSISCLTVDEAGLAAFEEIFGLEKDDWQRDAPYCSFPFEVGGRYVTVVFQMNAAGLSKFDPDWLRERRDQLARGEWLETVSSEGEEGELCAVNFFLNRTGRLVYQTKDGDGCFEVVLDEKGRVREDGGGGSFLGFVLLKAPEWDQDLLVRELQEEWGIEVGEQGSEDGLVVDVDGITAVVSLIGVPVPDGEAEENAKFNYMWPQAAEAAQAHEAQLMVAVLGSWGDPIKCGELFVKVLSACAGQPGALGVYTNGTVLEPAFYRSASGMLKEGELPILNWIWFGLFRRDGRICGYTYGMRAFGYDEMEVLDADGLPSEVRELLVNLAVYVLSSGAVLQDGETIGFSADDRRAITRSEGVCVSGMTLKIEFEGE